MPQLGLGLRASISGSSVYDGDAAAYFTSAGITSSTAKAQINSFVKGIKELGLYSNMAAWPLRQDQNNNSTSTAKSLGGLGSYDFVFTGSPTVGTDGLTTNGTTQYGNATIGSANLRTYSIVYIQKVISVGGNWFSYGGGRNAGSGNFSINVSSTGGRGLGVTQPNLNIANDATSNGTGFYEVAFSGGATAFSAWTIGGNNSAISGNWGSTSGTPNILNLGVTYNDADSTYGPLNAQFSCAIAFNISLTKAQHNSVYNLYKSTLGVGLGLTDLDAEAQTFFTTAGVTDATAKQQISDFVVGVKGLGLYNSMVCWPLRSAQNAGSGTTAYSLGGAGIYNGTLTNGPTWGADGVIFDGSNDYISGSSSISTNNTGTIFYCGIHATMTGSQKGVNINKIELGKAESVSFGIEATQLVSPFPTVGRASAISGFGSDVRYTATGVYIPSSTTMIRFYNGASKETNGGAVYGAFATEGIFIGTRINSNSHFNGTISIAAYFNSALSDANVLAVHNLYKTTLGSGLGLP
jgi:hypothetical protein